MHGFEQALQGYQITLVDYFPQLHTEDTWFIQKKLSTLEYIFLEFCAGPNSISRNQLVR
jgi:hypothetical protein